MGAQQLFLCLSPVFLFWVLGAFGNKLEHQAAEISLVNGLKRVAPAPAGVVEIKYPSGNDWIIWPSAAGNILKQAWGEAHYYAMFYSLDAYRDDLQWQYHVYILQTGALKRPLVLDYFAMSGFPGERCTTRYTAQWPSSIKWTLLSGLFPDQAPAANISKTQSVCDDKAVMPNPSPQKLLIP